MGGIEEAFQLRVEFVDWADDLFYLDCQEGFDCLKRPSEIALYFFKYLFESLLELIFGRM